MKNYDGDSLLENRTAEFARAFGQLIRESRTSQRLSQDEVALATGIGRRFLSELEAGKPSCQLGRSLLVADALGMKIGDILRLMRKSVQQSSAQAEATDALPDVEEEAADGQSPRLL